MEVPDLLHLPHSLFITQTPQHSSLTICGKYVTHNKIISKYSVPGTMGTNTSSVFFIPFSLFLAFITSPLIPSSQFSWKLKFKMIKRTESRNSNDAIVLVSVVTVPVTELGWK
jgi:hypothetical protein